MGTPASRGQHHGSFELHLTCATGRLKAHLSNDVDTVAFEGDVVTQRLEPRRTFDHHRLDADAFQPKAKGQPGNPPAGNERALFHHQSLSLLCRPCVASDNQRIAYR